MINNPVAKKLALQSWLLPLIFISPLFAADAPPVTFRGLAIAGEVDGIYFDNVNGEAQEFRASDYVRSIFYKAIGGRVLEFYKIIPSDDVAEKSTRLVVGRIDVPPDRGPYLLLVSQTNSDYNFSLTNDDDSSFPMGSFKVINLSDISLNLSIDDKYFRLNPKQTKIIRPSIPEPGKGILFQVEKESTKPLLLYTNFFPVTDDARSLVFIIDKKNPSYPVSVVRYEESSLQLERLRETEEREAKEAKKQ